MHSLPCVCICGEQRGGNQELDKGRVARSHSAQDMVLTICSFTVLPSSSIVRILKSTPIVLR